MEINGGNKVRERRRTSSLLDELAEEDKKFVIGRMDKLNPLELVELCNELGEYMESWIT